MSRCFPYPPPGYSRKGARVEAALIESIKLQSQKCKSDKKKEKSSEKKRRSKEHKDKSSRTSGIKVRKGNDLSGLKHKECKEKIKNIDKVAKDEAEQVEKSGLTEEHGQPQTPGSLSDGAQSSHKRKRVSSQPNEGHGPGRIIRLKLTSRKQQEQDPSIPKEQTICSTSGRENFISQKRDGISISPQPFEEKLCVTNLDTVDTVAINDATSQPLIEVPLSVDAVEEIGPFIDATPLYGSKNYPKSAYEELFDSWVPPSTQLEQYDDCDEEWLFGTRRQNGQPTKSKQDIGQVPSCRSSSLWPRGQYLPEADIFALPYTIPY